MKNKLIMITLILLAAGLSTARAQSNAALTDAVAKVQTSFSDFFVQGNFSRLSELYTADAEMVDPDGTVIRGRDNIRAFWQAYRDRGGYRTVEVHNTEIAGAGAGFAYSVGTCRSARPDGTSDQRRYLVIWKREGSHWRLFRTIASVTIGS